MVAFAMTVGAALAAAENAGASPAKDLPEPVRQVAYMALLGIALLGMLIVVITLLGGHWVRRWGDRSRGPAVPPDLIVPRDSSPKENSDRQIE